MQLEQQESFRIEGPQLEVFGQIESKLPAPAKKRPTAVLAIVLAALVAVFGIGGAKLKGRQASVQALYTATNEHGSGMTGDLALRADAAANLIRLCGQVLGTDDATVQAAQAALDGWNAAADAGGPADQFAANTALGSAVGTMYNKVYDNDKMNEDIERQYAVFLSAQSTITHTAEEYNSTARQYNNSLKSFPANILAGLWGMEEVELFQ